MASCSMRLQASNALQRRHSCPAKLGNALVMRAARASYTMHPMTTLCPSAASSVSHAISRMVAPMLPRPTARKPCVTARAAWGAPVEFSNAKVVSNKQATKDMHVLVVDVGQTIAAGYTKPGQYIQAKVDAAGKAGFFAIASGPEPNNAGCVELLIKAAPGSTAEAICALAPGAALLVSPVQGKGFPVDQIPAEQFPTVLLFATGSGISPIKAVIESGALGQRKEVRLYYGTKNAETTAYKELIPQWQAQGVKVVQVYSGDSKQYIQGVFEAEPKLADPAGTGVLLCGQKDMCQAVTAAVQAQGVTKVLMNF